jgi:hypothetical protein
MLSPDFAEADGAAFPYIAPGDPSDSLIYLRMQNGTMPPMPSVAEPILGEQAAAALVYPTAADLSVMNAWITQCTGAPPPSETDATVAMDSGQGSPDGAPPGPGDATVPLDSPMEISDAAVPIDVAPPPPGVAGFAFVVNDVAQTPMSCPSEDWEFSPPPGMGGRTVCAAEPVDGAAGCPGVYSAVLANTGQVPVAYLAASYWNLPSSGYRPGVVTVSPGDTSQLAGVLNPGDQVNITSVYAGGIVAILGSSQPFSEPDANYASDEGTVPWPGGVGGSNGSAQMWIAEIEVQSTCTIATQVW